jgi:16S rRNA (cytosine967-C5)-methyltransferase
MKLHKILVKAVADALLQIFIDKQQTDRTVEQLFLGNKAWGARDRNFIADNVYTIVRYKRLYEFCAETEITDLPSAYKVIGTKLIIDEIELPAWDEFDLLNKSAIASRYDEAKKVRALRESVPEWLDEKCAAEIGKTWDDELFALNCPAQFCIRVNTLKTSKTALKVLFMSEKIEFTETHLAVDALIIKGKKNFRNNEAYKNGLFEVQDVSSQMVANMLQVEPGLKVTDACAGAGGKSLHLACLMKNEGSIFAMDINERKLKELESRASRNGVRIIKTKLATDGTIGGLRHTADRLLLDVPCSGLGVLRRKPDTKWSLTPESLEEIMTLQQKILNQYSVILKPGGILVYSTCSILPSENEKQVKKFLDANPDYSLIGERTISPAETGFDGFYIASIRKNG